MLDNIKPMVYTFPMTPKELKAWRKKNSYSQIQLAKLLGVATQTVYRWENKKREIPSFLHLTLECVEKKGGEGKVKRETKKRKGVKKIGKRHL